MNIAQATLRTTRHLVTGLCMVVSTAWGATFIVDDSASQVLEPNIGLGWRSLAPAQGDHTVQGQTRVRVRLDTRAWQGQSAKIYMALPPQPSAAVQASWQAQGPLQAGQLRSGSRGLVWAGVVPGALLEDTLTVTVQTDGRFLSTPQALRFYFEIELP
jgi:hypothetical protein